MGSREGRGREVGGGRGSGDITSFLSQLRLRVCAVTGRTGEHCDSNLCQICPNFLRKIIQLRLM